MAQPNFFVAYLAQKLSEGGSETEVFLDRITNLNGEQVTTSDLATLGRGILTVEPDGDGLAKFPENIAFTTVDTANTKVTGATRGLDKAGNEDSDLKRFHPIDTPVIISIGTHSIQDLIDYIDDEINTVSAGTDNVVSGTAGETLAANEGVYLSESDGRWYHTDATDTSTYFQKQLGVAQGAAASAGDSITNGVLRLGTVSGQSGLTAGNLIYLSDTNGEFSESVGTNPKIVGVARSSTEFYFDPNFRKKHIQKRVTSETSSATPTINTNETDVHRLTDQSVNITDMSSNLSGSPAVWNILVIEINAHSGGSIDITWGSSFESGDVYNLPTSVDADETLKTIFNWNGSTWSLIGYA